MSTSGVIGFKGIASSPNPLNSPPGSLELATNCVILSKDNLEPRRGQPPQAFTFGNNTQASNQLAEWTAKQRLLVAYSAASSFTSSGGLAILSSDGLSWSSALDTPIAPDPNNQRMKFAEMANNIYYTTTTGLRFLDSVTASGAAAGAPRPCDFNTTVATAGLSGNPDAAGSWLAANSSVGYRACVVKKDANNNVKVSAPSGRIVIVNPADISCGIGTVVRATNVVTATVAAGHGYRAGDVFVLGPNPTTDANFVAGNYTVTSSTSTTVVWSSVGADAASAAVMTIKSGTRSVLMRVYFGNAGGGGATGVAALDFVRLYRTTANPVATADSGDEEALCYERQLAAADITNGYIDITDTTPDSFLGEPLYSNANTGEGATQTNNRPPLMNDCCVFDGRLFGAQTTDRHSLTLRLLGTGSPNGLQSGDIICVGKTVIDTTGLVFSQYLPSQNILLTAANVVFSYGVSLSYTLDAGRTARLISDGSSPTGQMIFEDISVAGSVFYAATNRPSAFQDPLPNVFAVTAASTTRTSNVTTVTTGSAHGFSTGDTIVLAYKPASNDNSHFSAGAKTSITVTGATTFTYADPGSNGTMAGGTIAYVYAAKYKSDNYAKQLRFTKQGQPEAWPQINWIGGLPDGAELSRIFALRNSLYVFLKHGPIYTVSGSYPYNVQQFDNTAQLVAADSLVRHANRLFALTTQGVCAISENGVQVMSLDIDSALRVLVATAQSGSAGYASNMAAFFGVSYESDRQYQLWVQTAAGGTNANAAYVFQSDIHQWTYWTGNRSCGLVFSQDNSLYLGDYENGFQLKNYVRKELKSYARTDYDDLAASAFGDITTVAGVTRFTPTIAPQTIANVIAGDTILTSQGNTTVASNAGTYLTLAAVLTGDTGTIINVVRSISSTFQWLIFPAGTPGILKHWREAQLHFAGYLLPSSWTATFNNERSGSTTTAVTVGSDLTTAIDATTLTPLEVRIAVPTAMQRAAMIQMSGNINLPRASWQLLGWSTTSESISEKTGK